MANISNVVEVLLQLKTQGAESINQVTDSLNNVISALGSLETAVKKRSTESIASALRAVKTQGESAKPKIDELASSFGKLQLNINKTADALSKIKIPEGLKSLSVQIGATADTVEATATPKKPRKTRTPKGQTATPEAADITAATQAEEGLENAIRDTTSAEADNAAKTKDMTAANERAEKTAKDLTVRLQEQVTIFRAARDVIDNYNKAVTEGLSQNALQAPFKAARQAFKEIENIVKQVSNTIKELNVSLTSGKLGNIPGLQKLVGELGIAQAIFTSFRTSVQEGLDKESFDKQTKSIHETEKAINALSGAVDKYQLELKDVSQEQYAFKPPETVSAKTAESGIKDLETKLKDVAEAERLLGTIPINTSEIDKLRQRISILREEALKLKNQFGKTFEVNKEATAVIGQIERIQARLNDLSKLKAETDALSLTGRLPRAGISDTEVSQAQQVYSNINRETTTLYRNLDGLKTKLREVFKGDQASISEFSQRITEAQQKLLGMNSSAAQSARIFKEYSANIGVYGDILRSATQKNINSLSDLTATGATIGKSVEGVFARFAASTGVSAEKTLLLSQALQHLETQMVRFRSGVVTWSIGLVMAVTAIAAPLKTAISLTADLSDNIAQAGAVTGATAEEFMRLNQAAKDMGRTTRFTAVDASKALVQLGRNGFTANESIALLPTTLQLAAGAAIDLGEAADIVTNIMTAFRLEIEDFASTADILTKAVNTSNATLPNLGFAFTYVGSLAKGLGADFTDLIGALSKLHDAGFKGTMAGTALRGALDGLFNPTKDEARVMKELSDRLGLLGFNIRDAEGNFVGWVSIIRQLESAAFTSEEALRLFGQRAGPGVAALLKIGSEELQNYTDQLRNSAGTTQALADVMQNTLQGTFLKLKSALQGLGESFGAGIEPALKGLSNLAADLINVITDIREAFEPLTGIIDTIVGGFVSLAGIIGSVTFAWFVMIVPVKQLKTALSVLFGSMKTGLGILAGLSQGVQATTSEIIKLSSLQTKMTGLVKSISALEGRKGDETAAARAAELRKQLDGLTKEYVELRVAIEQASIAQAKQNVEMQAASIKAAVARNKYTELKQNQSQLGLTDYQVKKQSVLAGREAAAAYRASQAIENASKGLPDFNESTAATRNRVIKEQEAQITGVFSALAKKAEVEGQKAGLSFGKRFVGSVKTIFANFANSGAMGPILILLSNFFTKISADFINASILADLLVGSTIGWAAALEKVKAIWLGIWGVLKNLNPIVRTIAIAIGAITLVYSVLRDSNKQALEDNEKQIKVLDTAISKYTILADKVAKASKKINELDSGTGNISKGFVEANKELVSGAKELDDLNRALAKSDIEGLQDKLIKVEVRNDVKGLEGVRVWTAVLADGSSQALALAEASNKATANQIKFNEVIKQQQESFTRVKSELAIQQITLYAEKIKSLQSDIQQYQRTSGLWLIGEGQGERLKETQIALENIRTRLALTVAANADNQIILENILSTVREIDPALANIVKETLQISRGFGEIKDRNLDTAFRRSALAARVLKEAVLQNINEAKQGLDDLASKLGEAFTFNSDYFTKQLDTIKSSRDSALKQLEESYSVEDTLNTDANAAWRAYGQEREKLFRDLSKQGIEYDIAESNAFIDLAYEKVSVNEASYQRMEEAFYDYYVKQRTLLSGLQGAWEKYGFSVPQVVLDMFQRVKPVLENLDKSISTEKTFTKEVDGRFYVIPQIVAGKDIGEDEAFKKWQQGLNKEVGVYATEVGAEAGANLRSALLGKIRISPEDVSSRLQGLKIVRQYLTELDSIEPSNLEKRNQLLGQYANQIIPTLAAGNRETEASLNAQVLAAQELGQNVAKTVGDFEELARSVAKANKEIEQSAELTGDAAQKALEELNNLDSQALEFLRDLSKDRIKDQEDLLKTLTGEYKKYVDQLNKLEQGRVKVVEQVEGAIRRLKAVVPPKVDTSQMTEEEKQAYERKQRVLQAQEFERRQADLTLDYYRALGSGSLDEIEKVKDAAIKFSDEVSAARDKGDIKVGLDLSGYNDIVSESGIVNLLRMVEQTDKAFRERLGKGALEGADRAKKGIEGVNATLMDLRGYLESINISLSEAFKREGVFTGMTDALGNISPAMQKVSDGITTLANSIEKLGKSLANLNSLELVGRQVTDLTQSKDRLSTFDRALNKTVVAITEYNQAITDVGNTERQTQAFAGVQTALRELGQSAPDLETVFNALSNIEGIDKNKLAQLRENVSNLTTGYSIQELLSASSDTNKEVFNKFSAGLITLVGQTKNTALELIGSIDPVIESVKEKYYKELSAIKEIITGEIGDALKTLKEATNLGKVEINIDETTAKLLELENSFKSLKKAKESVEGKIEQTVEQTVEQTTEKKPDFTVASNKKSEADITVTYTAKTGGDIDDVIKKSEEEAKKDPVDVPVQPTLTQDPTKVVQNAVASKPPVQQVITAEIKQQPVKKEAVIPAITTEKPKEIPVAIATFANGKRVTNYKDLLAAFNEERVAEGLKPIEIDFIGADPKKVTEDAQKKIQEEGGVEVPSTMMWEVEPQNFIDNSTQDIKSVEVPTSLKWLIEPKNIADDATKEIAQSTIYVPSSFSWIIPPQKFVKDAQEEIKRDVTDIPVFVTPEIKRDRIVNLLDSIKEFFTGSKIEIEPELKNNVLKSQYDALESYIASLKAQLKNTELELNLSIKLANEDDITQTPIMNALSERMATLNAELETAKNKAQVTYNEILQFAKQPVEVTTGEGQSPFAGLVSAIDAGKTKLVEFVNGAVAQLTGVLNPAITTVKTALTFEPVGLDVSPAVAALNQLISLLAQAINLKNQLSVIDANVPTDGTTPQANAAGGYITGPGSGVSDSILSWLSNGEYVMDAMTTRFFSPQFFKRLQEFARKGKMPNDLLSGFADGGLVKSVAKNFISRARIPKFNKGGLNRLKENVLTLPKFNLPKFASGGLASITSGLDYAKIGSLKPQLAGPQGTPVNLTIYDHKFALTATPSVADELRKILSKENIKRGRR